MPRPLSSYKPGHAVALGNTGPGLKDIQAQMGLAVGNSHLYPLELRPSFIPLAMRVISAWSIVDAYVSRTLAAMVGGSQDVTLAMYSSLGSAATQHTVLKAAAKVALPARQQEVLSALLGEYNKIRKFRDRVAHHLWGISNAAPDGIILIDPRTLDLLAETDEDLDWDAISVYDEADFNSWVEQIENLCSCFHDFYFIVGPKKAQADQLLDCLCREPLVHRYLQKGTKGSPAAPPAQPQTPPPTEAPKN